MNFGQMKTYIAARLIDPLNQSVTSDQIGEAINDSIRYWKIRRFWFNEVRDSATMTAQDAVIPLPTDFLVPFSDDDGFAIFYSETRYPLIKITQQQYDNYYLANGFGLPRFYAHLAGSYHTWWIPDNSYTIQRHYIKDYADLSSDSDANDFTTNVPRLINLWALGNLIGELRQDGVMADAYQAKAEDEYRNICVFNNKVNGTGKLTLSSSLLNA